MCAVEKMKSKGLVQNLLFILWMLGIGVRTEEVACPVETMQLFNGKYLWIDPEASTAEEARTRYISYSLTNCVHSFHTLSFRCPPGTELSRIENYDDLRALHEAIGKVKPDILLSK